MPNLAELAGQLSDLYKARKNLQIELAHLDADTEARKVFITPAAGWLADLPKSNEGQREIARLKAFAADEILKACEQKARQLHDQLSEVEMQIECLQEMASAERWRIREKLADALTSKAQGERVETSPKEHDFDTALQLTVDEELPF